MRTLTVPLLVVLLALTTPVGTGTGVHQDDLLHPVFPHVHLINGRVMSDAQLAVATRQATPAAPSRAPALGAGTGAASFAPGMAIGPYMPILGFVLAAPPESPLPAADIRAPSEFRDAPEDPPPNLFA